jgi:predicted enzyme related to lactoylglutathione lyase
MSTKASQSPVINRIPAVFIPVRNLEKAKKWYGEMLGLDGETRFGHIFVASMQGEGMGGLVLDEMPNWRGPDGDILPYQAPAIQFSTDDVAAAYAFMKERGVEMVSEVENDFFFVFKDPDGNHLMVCEC